MRKDNKERKGRRQGGEKETEMGKKKKRFQTLLMRKT